MSGGLELPIIQSLWIGEELSAMERLCITSRENRIDKNKTFPGICIYEELKKRYLGMGQNPCIYTGN